MITCVQFEAGSSFAPSGDKRIAVFSNAMRASILRGESAKPDRTVLIVPTEVVEIDEFFTISSRIPAGENFRYSCSTGRRMRSL